MAAELTSYLDDRQRPVREEAVRVSPAGMAGTGGEGDA